MPMHKKKSTLLYELDAKSSFDAKFAEEILEYCKRNKCDPYKSIILQSHLQPAVFAAWTDPKTKQWFTSALSAISPFSTEATDGEFRDAVVLVAEPYFKGSDENAFTLYRVADRQQRVLEPIEGDQITVLGRTLAADLESCFGTVVTMPLATRMFQALKLHGCTMRKPKLLGQPLSMCATQDDWCLHRATVVPDSSMPFPHVRSFLDRLNDAEAFGAYIAGIYFDLYRGRQILYISDLKGLGGKSKLFTDAIMPLFGERITAALTHLKMSESPHASAHFVGKKLAVVGDNKNPSIIMSQAIKELSGDDKVVINQKNQPIYSTYLEVKLIILSNHKPNITSEPHNSSRTLWLELAPLNLPENQLDPTWGKKCAAEMPGFLAWALDCYRRRCLNDNVIEVNLAVDDAKQKRIDEYEDPFSLPFAKYFVHQPGGNCSPS
jgi:hypothetical protein